MKKGYEITGVVQRPPRFLVDKSANVSYQVGEMSTQQKMDILNLEGSIGTLMFIPEDVQTPDLQKIDAQYEGKSSSERLYSVQFVCWKHYTDLGKIDVPFETWRQKEMERLIQAYKDKLP